MGDTVYTAEATAAGGRTGRTRSSDGVLDVELGVPSELGGEGDATNPEQLFAAGYAGCFMSALTLIGDKRRQDMTGTQVTARVGLVSADGGLELAVALRADVPNVDRDEAEALLQRAHKHCPYSKAISGNVEVELAVGAHREAGAPAGA